MRVPLDKAGFAGVVAIVRPLDVEDSSRWTDAFPDEKARNLAATQLVKQQLIRIEGLEMKHGDSSVPYDHTNPSHWRSLPLAMRNPIYAGIMANVSISGDQEKN